MTPGTRPFTGISFKTQELYVAVFLTRYLDLLWYYVSAYNESMKLFFIGSSCYIVYLMRVKYRFVMTGINSGPKRN